jgi:aspartyl protease family protein
MTTDDMMHIFYLAILLVSVTGWMLVEYRQKMGQALRVLLAWGMIFLGLGVGYGLWHDLRHDIMPVQQVEGGRVVIPRARDGHYYLRLKINGQSIQFMADTGASNIVLSPEDARALGIAPESLRFLGEAQTANGSVRTARIKLPEVELGPFQDTDVTAYVNEADMNGSLLGMDYLGLFSISIQGDEMILQR